MLTRQEVFDAFVNTVNVEPDAVQIDLYVNYTKEELDVVLNRRLAGERDPTYTQRLAEDFIKYMAATPEEQLNWQRPEPNPQ
jgi:phosphoribulokinase